MTKEEQIHNRENIVYSTGGAKKIGQLRVKQ